MQRFTWISILAFVIVTLVVACQSTAFVTPAPDGTSVASKASPTPRPTNTPTPTATPSPTPTPRPTRTPTPASSSANPADEAASLPGSPFEMTLTEREVNELAQEALATQSDVPISNPYVRLEEGQMVASGQVRVGFFNVNVELTGIVPVEDGKPAPEIVGIKVNGQPIGGLLRTQLMNMITPYLDQLAQADLAVDFEEFQIMPRKIRITGRYK